MRQEMAKTNILGRFSSRTPLKKPYEKMLFHKKMTYLLKKCFAKNVFLQRILGLPVLFFIFGNKQFLVFQKIYDLIYMLFLYKPENVIKK